MSKHEIKLDSSKSISPAQRLLSANKLRRNTIAARWLAAVAIVVAVMLLQALPALGQATPTPSPTPDLPCPTALTPGQTFLPVPVIDAVEHRLRGTVLLSDEQEWIPTRIPNSAPSDSSRSQCQPQYVRIFRELGATPTLGAAPYGPYARGSYALPRPGPTLRARVGDLVQLTFINDINPANFGDSIDRAERGRGNGCDESSSGYPGSVNDKYPDCFHGSSTGNIHFHGTHTNPNTTGDNVFIEVRPSLREDGKPVVTPDSVKESFKSFFDRCEIALRRNVLKEWPLTWDDLPDEYTKDQKKYLKRYDDEMEKNYGSGVKKLWPVDEEQLKQRAWPQYYIGAFPYCYRLPEYVQKTWPPPKTGAMEMSGSGTAELHMAPGAGMTEPDADDNLIMGQSPGLHWYHAHKHGSTAINVANGMTGAFIIEGQYDDDLNAFYGKDWTRTQKVMVINQLGVSPNLMRGSGGRQDKGPDFSVNGQLKPMIDMKPGEVQMWRIVNTSGRAGAFVSGLPAGFEWRQLAQDGVQFSDTNYKHRHKPFLLAAGNRVDLLVKAPPDPCTNPKGCVYPVKVQNEVDPQDLTSAEPITLMSVNVSGTPVDPNSNGAKFIDHAPYFPPFLTDIGDNEIKGTKKIVFASTGPGKNNTHMIDGKKFDGEVGVVVLLNQAEEWKVINETYDPISHPFHIHINPFQITEVFDPNEILTDKNGKPVIDPVSKSPVNKYVFQGGVRRLPGQCYLNPFADPDTWKPCGPVTPNKDNIWWDVFPIPSGRQVKAFKIDSVTRKGTPVTVNVPGYFKMRSRFVDYSGFYVIHCHILAHEDRGMMTIVEVSPARTPYSHN